MDSSASIASDYLMAKKIQTRGLDDLLLVERVGGIEPPFPAWKAGALPLSYTRFARPLSAGRSTSTGSPA